VSKVFTHLAVFILLSAPLYPVAQDAPYVFDKVNTTLRRHCAFCKYHFPEGYDSVLLRLMRYAGAETFHESHTALQRGGHESAYRFAQSTIAFLNDSIRHPLYASALFLWAKTNHLKGLVQSAARQYSQFLTINAADSALRGDAYASLGDLYIQNGDWEKAAYVLDTWQRYYLRVADAKTTADLFDRILNTFNDSLVTQPQMAIGIGTELFTKQKDTARLIRFYYNIALWYHQQSKEGHAIVYLKRGLTLALRSGDYGMQKRFYRDLALLEEKNGQYQTAAHYKKAYDAASDSLYQSGPSPVAFYVQKTKLLQLIKSHAALLPGHTELSTTELIETGKHGFFLFLFATFLLLFILVRKSLTTRSRLLFLHGEMEQLQEANASKDQLLSIIAHDLRSAVHALQINISKLKTALEKPLPKEALAFAESTEQSAGAIQSLLNNLLYWSLSQAGRISYHPEPVGLQPLLNGICYDLKPVAASKNITLTYTLEQDLVCNCDVNTTKIIFRNLIDNAIKYTPADGAVTVSAQPQELLCAATVQDTGIGMAQRIIDALFTKKSTRIQQDASGRRSTGIGLWLVKNMTEQNGGALHISSVEGVGTTMTVTLPLAR
jgi:signal transduction histidine kinase